MLYYFKKDKNATEMQEKLCAVYGEGEGTSEDVKSGLRSFMLEVSCWTMLHDWADELKMIVIISRQ